jgi:hypothetical protein
VGRDRWRCRRPLSRFSVLRHRARSPTDAVNRRERSPGRGRAGARRTLICFVAVPERLGCRLFVRAARTRTARPQSKFAGDVLKQVAARRARRCQRRSRRPAPKGGGMNRQLCKQVIRGRSEPDLATQEETEDMASRSPFKAGTKKLKKGWKYPRGGGRPVKAKGTKSRRPRR